MDMDIRKAIRFIEAAGFNGLGQEELERFMTLAAQSYYENRFKFKVGDKVKYETRGKILYGRISSLPDIKFANNIGLGSDYDCAEIKWGDIEIKWELKVVSHAVSRFTPTQRYEAFTKIEKFEWDLESIF